MRLRRLPLVLSLLAGCTFAAQQNRLALGTGPDQDMPVAVRGSVHPLANAGQDLGRMDSNRVISGMALMFSRTPQQRTDIEQLENALHDPSSPRFHQWLTPEQVAQRFGVSDADLQTAAAWLRAQGFTVDSIPPSRDRVVFSGDVATIERALGTQMHQYQARGSVGFANATEITLPKGLAANIIGVRNLSNFPLKPRAVARHVSPHLTSEITGSTFVTPDDFATIFGVKALYKSGIDGTGQTIAVVGQTNIDIANVRAFRTAAGLPANDPVLVPTIAASTAASKDDLDEAYLDVEWSGAIAKNATVKYVWTPKGAPGGVLAALDFAITHNVAPIISLSYGSCELDNGASDFTQIDGMMQTATLQGQTLISASGDQGAADCESSTATTSARGLAVDVPASLPDVVGIGGTRFSGDANAASVFWAVNSNPSNGSALSYIGETSWNDTAEANSLSSTGGGASIHYPRPTWQNLAEMPADQHRLVPDISFPASPDHDGYLMCGAGTCVNGFRQANSNFSVIGGTSVGAPAFAGVLALIEQANGGALGSLNRLLYPASQASSTAFHDITSGDNKVPCNSSASPAIKGCTNGTLGFAAGPGYDLVTGLGTPDAFNLEEALNAGTKTITKTAITSAVPTPAVSDTVTITAQTTPVVGSGSMQLIVDGAFVGTPVAVAAGSAAFTTSFTAPGNHAVSVTYFGSAGNTGSSSLPQSVFVSTTQPASYKLGLNPGTLTLSRSGASATSTALGTAINNYSGNVSLACAVTAGVTSAVLPTCTLSSTSLVLSTQQATANSAVTIAVPAPVALLTHPLTPKHSGLEWWAAGSTAAFGCVFLFGGRTRRKYTGVALLVIAGLFVGCGGGGGNSASSSTTPTTTSSSVAPGNYTVTVTGTDANNVKQTATVTLTVQ